MVSLFLGLSMVSYSIADDFIIPPAPPSFHILPAPATLHSDKVAVIEPSLPPRNSPRGPTPGALVENGENGASGVEDHSGDGYELLQDSVAGQGSYAFHLADRFGHWFKLNTSVAITSGCKLFFLSRLGTATADQIAKVQISTTSGSTWASTVWSQAGVGHPGETGFSLKTIDLAAFVGDTIQIRFLYDFGSGNFFPQNTPGVGWYIDNIQVGIVYSKDPYLAFGDPTNDEQHYLEYINRARASASAEAQRLKNETDPLIISAYTSFSLNPANIPIQFAWNVNSGCMVQTAQPLAFNNKLLSMARLHSQDMFTNIFQGHVSSASPPAPFQPGDTLGLRSSRVGYSGGLGENVYAYSRSVAYGHAGFDVDWGSTTNTSSSCYNAAFAGQAMQNPPGHRLSIHNGTFREVGIGVINGTNGSVGPQIVTQNYGQSGGIVVTGVVYLDSNSNSFYNPNEGIGGVRVDIPQSAFYTTTSASGGYALPVDGNGVYAVTFSGGGVPTRTVNATVSGGNNVKFDYRAASVSNYTTWAAGLGVTGGENGDHDKDGVKNLVEYALSGFNPLVPDPQKLPSLIASGGTGTLTVQKNINANGLTYAVHTSTNLQTWAASGYTIVTNNTTTLKVSIALTTGTQTFARIVVSK